MTNWALFPDNYVLDEPEWVRDMEQVIKACPGHLWELLLEGDETVHLHCQRCPASVDDLYPDGHEMIYYTSEDGRIIVESGTHNLDEDDTPVAIPVTAHVVSGYNYLGEFDAELIIGERSVDEAPSSVGDGS